MMKFLDENKVITNCQYGFIKKKSCFTNLLTTLKDWTFAIETFAIDQGHGVDVASLDLVKHSIQYHTHSKVGKLWFW